MAAAGCAFLGVLIVVFQGVSRELAALNAAKQERDEGS